MNWINNLLEYTKHGKSGKCPFCGSEKVDVIEHVFGERKSLTFICNDCKKSDHFDGQTSNLNK